VFGSELKSVIASGLVPLDLDYEAIEAFLTFGYVPGCRTLIAGVSKLLPGERLVVSATGADIDTYWTYPEPTPMNGASAAECGGRLLQELELSVRRRLMSDVPVGAMLSGGLDSSLIVALMSRSMRDPVKTFSIGFSEAGWANELDDARRVAQMFGTDHHELELSFADDVVDLDELVWHLDEPIADLSALGFYALSEFAARDVKVALSGQGADELLGGYRKHQAASIVPAWEHLPARSGPQEGRSRSVARSASGASQEHLLPLTLRIGTSPGVGSLRTRPPGSERIGISCSRFSCSRCGCRATCRARRPRATSPSRPASDPLVPG
jgi:asparagine synthase (glutamine-hydrolysing)